MNPKYIFITGCPRSGTSLVAGIINLCGAFGGRMRKSSINNRKGYFENMEITQNIVKPFLRSVDADPRGQNPFPDQLRVSSKADYISSEWKEWVLNIAKKEGHKENAPFMYKEPKMCLIWRVWNKAFPDAFWIIVRRKKEDIADSCLKATFMDTHQTKDGWLQWIDYYLDRFEEMKVAKLDVKEIWSEEIIKGNLDEIKNVVGLCGLTYNEASVNEFISPNLWKGGQLC